MTTRLLSTGAACALLVFTALPADAQIVGPGTNIPNDALDTPGGRIIVDQSVTLTLAPGTYTASLFNFDAGIAGDVTPFLAISIGTNLYRAIAVGSTRNIGGAMSNASVPFGGSATFTLNATTQIFAGISSNNQNPVPLDDNTAPNTDLEGGGQANYTVTVGGTVPPDGSFSNPNIGRTYAFSIAVVPEPATVGLVVLGGAAMLAWRRWRA